MNELIGSGLGGLWVIPALEWAKKTNLSIFRWVNPNNAQYVSIVVALISAMGMHFQYDQATKDWHLSGNVDMMVHGVVQFTVSHWGHKFYAAAKGIQAIAEYVGKIPLPPGTVMPPPPVVSDVKSPAVNP